MKSEKTESIINPHINKLLGKDLNAVTSWNNLPIYIEECYRSGVISSRERLVYLSLRSQCNPYGVCLVSVDDIRSDVFANKCDKPHVNKILSKLKKYRLIWFKERKGVAGKFEVHFDDFFCPHGVITDLQNKFNCKFKAISDPSEEQGKQEDNQGIRTLDRKDFTSVEVKTTSYENIKVVGSHTDTHPHTQKSTVSNKARKYKCKNTTYAYKPNSSETLYVWNMAKEIDDLCLDWYLGLIEDGNFWIIEKAYGELKEDIQKGNHIENKAPYLNGIIKRLLRERATKSV